MLEGALSAVVPLALLAGLPPETYAIASAFAWAFSTLFVNRGLSRMRAADGENDIFLGLAASLLVGCLFLTAVTVGRFSLSDVSLTLVAAGVLTFPVGTGLYYYTAERYRDRAEIAAQFSKVKPIFSVLIALVFLREAISSLIWLALGLIVLGVSLLLWATVRSQFSLVTAVLGLATALAWSAGEGFMAVGVEGTSSLLATYVAILTGSLVYLLAVFPVFGSGLDPRGAVGEGWLLPFAGHGLLSFGIAYTLFFTSIGEIGLARTALITAFWPMLALGIGYLVGRLTGDGVDERIAFRHLFLAAGFLVAGSAIAAVY
ncbi:EamA family transporter [Halobacteria archaeon AArc-dxtr1]|nr:EamA family transporter [Halobacteria archaeon AArc-dxtr1]